MITFTITFHTPFHVSTGTSERGLDRLVDAENPLPASSLKGRMRAAARETLRLDPGLVAAVFGSASDPSPWWWSDAAFSDDPLIRNVARVKIDDASGTTERGFLMFGQHVWADTATFTVAPRVTIARHDEHELVLRASARAITSLGGQRRRGEGWVTVTGGDWSPADTTRLITLRETS